MAIMLIMFLLAFFSSPALSLAADKIKVSALSINNIPVFGEITISGTLYDYSDSTENLEACRDEIIDVLNEMDAQITTKRIDGADSVQSKIYKFNNNIDDVAVVSNGIKKYPIDYHAYTMFTKAKNRFYSITGGFFDPTVMPLMELWGLQTDVWSGEHSRLPTTAEIENVLEYTGIDKITLYDEDGNYYISKSDTRVKVDLGAQAKGYAADIAIGIVEDFEVESATLSISGNLYVYNERPIYDYDGWLSGSRLYNVRITNPFHRCLLICDEDDFVVYKMPTNSVVTSGDYVRYYMFDGAKICHIIDPKTGYPLNIDTVTRQNSPGGLCSVSVFDTNSETADVYATAILLMGMERGIGWCLQNNVSALLIASDKTYANVNNFDLVSSKDYPQAYAIQQLGFKAVDGYGFDDPESEKSLSVLEIIGIVVAVVLSCAVLAVFVFMAIKNHKAAKQGQAVEPDNPES